MQIEWIEIRIIQLDLYNDGGDPHLLLSRENYGGATIGWTGGSNLEFRAQGGAGTAKPDHNDGALGFRMTKDGEITMPLQPAFLAVPSADQDNMSVGSRVTIVFGGTDIIDNNADFASNTFTAPVAGKYQLNAIVRVNQMDTDSNYHEVRIVTSNRTYPQFFNPTTTSGASYHTFNIATLADMDASDTAYVDYYSDNNAAEGDMIAGSTYFSGYLVC